MTAPGDESSGIQSASGAVPLPPAFTAPSTVGRDEWIVAWSAGLLVAACGAAPTGGRLTDLVLVTLTVALTVRAAATAPAWLIAVAAGLLTAYGLDSWLVVVCGLLIVGGVGGAEFRHRLSARGRFLGMTATVVLAAFLPTGRRFGESAAVGLAAAVVLALGGLRNEPRAVRRRYTFGLVLAAEAGLLFSGLAAYRLVRVRDDLRQLRDDAQIAVDSATARDPDRATAALTLAADEAYRLGDQLDSPLVRLAELVPIVAQHVRASRLLATDAGPALRAAANAVDVIRPERLSITNGRVDLDRIRQMTGAADIVALTLGRLRDELDDSRTGWLVSRVRDPLERLGRKIDHADDLAAGLSGILDRAPQLLGEDAPRRYLVAFITPSEARGLGGFLGNFAIVTANDGAISMTDFGRSKDLLDAAKTAPSLSLSGPSSYLDRYGPYGVGGRGKPTPTWWWQQVTVSPDLPSTAQAIAEMYRQTIGTKVDGVITVDPSTIQALMTATGPVETNTIDGTVSPDNVLEFLLRRQYVLLGTRPNEDRIDALETVARTTVNRLLDLGSVPTDTLARLGDVIAERHLMFWSADDAEQRAFARAGITGSFELRRDPSGDAIEIVNANGGPNKIDAFLHRDITYDGVLDTESGVLRAHVTVTLSNDIPSLDLEPQIVGNLKGAPLGTNRTFVTLYAAGQIGSSVLDGAPSTPSARGRELGWRFWEQLALVPPMGRSVIEYDTMVRIAEPSRVHLTIRTQPVANPDRYHVTIRTTHGGQLIAFDGQLSRTTTLQVPSS